MSPFDREINKLLAAEESLPKVVALPLDHY